MDQRPPIQRGSVSEEIHRNWATGHSFRVSPHPVFNIKLIRNPFSPSYELCLWRYLFYYGFGRPHFYPSTWDNIGLCIAQLSFARTCNMFRTLQYT